MRKSKTSVLIASIFAVLFFVLFLGACTPETGNKDEQQNQEENDDTEDLKESAQTIDLDITESDFGTAWEWDARIKISGEKFETMVAGDYITITTEISESNDGIFQLEFYELKFADFGDTVQDYNEKYNVYTLKDGQQNSVFYPDENQIAILKEKGLIITGKSVVVKKVTIRVNAYLDELNGLCDKQATKNTKRLYKYLNDVYGKNVITGQMENAWDNSFNQLKQVNDKTGKYPALMGFDFMQYTGQSWNPGDSLQQTQRARNFWNGKDYNGNKISDRHGIVTFCWHWFDPMHIDYSYDPEKISFRIPYDLSTKQWKTESQEYKAMIADMDVIAGELLKLQAADVPVIWRPLHEAAGNVGRYNNNGTAWFWWGAGSTGGELIEKTVEENGVKKTVNVHRVSSDVKDCSESFIALWKLMYEYFTETKGLHNLIWMWNAQNESFYPGSEYVDIIADDIYDLHQGLDLQSNLTTASGVDWFKKFAKVDQTKIVALSECGQMPYMEDLKKDGAMWSFFMVWNDSVNYEDNSNFWNGQAINSDERKMKIYSSDIAITLDELPDLTTY